MTFLCASCRAGAADMQDYIHYLLLLLRDGPSYRRALFSSLRLVSDSGLFCCHFDKFIKISVCFATLLIIQTILYIWKEYKLCRFIGFSLIIILVKYFVVFI